MRAADLVTALALIAVGVVVIADALRLGIGWGLEGPQSGFFPFWLAVLMVATAIVIAGQSWRRASGRPFVTAAQLRPVLVVLGPAVGLVVLTEGLGLYVASALYLGFYMRWVGRHAWTTIVALGLAIPIVTFVVFERWFLVPMPKGPLEAWLGF
jgi:putative tricarboxylic transport membrane protein